MRQGLAGLARGRGVHGCGGRGGGGRRRRRKRRRRHTGVAEFLKRLAGRYRPDFLDRCQPVPSPTSGLTMLEFQAQVWSGPPLSDGQGPRHAGGRSPNEGPSLLHSRCSALAGRVASQWTLEQSTSHATHLSVAHLSLSLSLPPHPRAQGNVGQGTGLMPADYSCSNTQLSPDEEINGRLSFPSGHSSMSMMSGM